MNARRAASTEARQSAPQQRWEKLQDLADRYWLWLIVLMFLLPLAVLFALMRNPGETIFTINAGSEIVRFAVSGRSAPDTFLPNADIDLFDDSGDQPRGLAGRLRLGELTVVTITRVGRRDFVDLRLEHQDLHDYACREPGACSAGAIYADDDELLLRLPAEASIRVAIPGDSMSLAWPLTGAISVGAIMPAQVTETNPIATGGSVRLRSASRLGAAQFQSGGTQLDPGDHIEVFTADGEPAIKAAGLVQLDPSGGLRVTLHAAGRYAVIERALSDPYRLEPSVWAALANDPSIQLLVFVYGVSWALFKALIIFIWRRRIDRYVMRGAPPPEPASSVSASSMSGAGTSTAQPGGTPP